MKKIVLILILFGVLFIQATTEQIKQYNSTIQTEQIYGGNQFQSLSVSASGDDNSNLINELK